MVLVQKWGDYMKELDMFVGAPTVAPPVYKPQPICAVIVGALFNDDKILSAAHRFQQATAGHTTAGRSAYAKCAAFGTRTSLAMGSTSLLHEVHRDRLGLAVDDEFRSHSAA